MNITHLYYNTKSFLTLVNLPDCTELVISCNHCIILIIWANQYSWIISLFFTQSGLPFKYENTYPSFSSALTSSSTWIRISLTQKLQIPIWFGWFFNTSRFTSKLTLFYNHLHFQIFGHKEWWIWNTGCIKFKINFVLIMHFSLVSKWLSFVFLIHHIFFSIMLIVIWVAKMGYFCT